MKYTVVYMQLILSVLTVQKESHSKKCNVLVQSEHYLTPPMPL